VKPSIPSSNYNYNHDENEEEDFTHQPGHHHNKKKKKSYNMISETKKAKKHSNFDRAADRADAMFHQAMEQLEVDEDGRRNPFRRSEAMGRVDVFANLYTYDYDELYHVVESALFNEVKQSFESRFPSLLICWTPQVVLEFASRYIYVCDIRVHVDNVPPPLF
jgi:hypothetical protein